jgi:histidyl-tRNA synthetase
MFRHERPQRGRYRQFHQLGCEAIGFAGPELDAELMILVADLLGRLGLSAFRVELNSLGLAAERLAHRAALISYFERNLEQLDAEGRRRLHTNPLRVLDTKNPAMQDLVTQAPMLLSFLGEASLKRLDAVKAMLTSAGIAWTVNPRMVRGLDYYSHTVFEFVTDQLGAQGTLCGGGRYDGLFELLGGKPTPGVGWGMGIERVLELVNEQHIQVPTAGLDAYAIVPDASHFAQAMALLRTLRDAGVSVQMHATGVTDLGSMKAQFKKADASGARHALIFGADELARGEVTVKALRDGKGEQVCRALDAAASWAPTLQSKP